MYAYSLVGNILESRTQQECCSTNNADPVMCICSVRQLRHFVHLSSALLSCLLVHTTHAHVLRVILMFVCDFQEQNSRPAKSCHSSKTERRTERSLAVEPGPIGLGNEEHNYEVIGNEQKCNM